MEANPPGPRKALLLETPPTSSVRGHFFVWGTMALTRICLTNRLHRSQPARTAPAARDSTERREGTTLQDPASEEIAASHAVTVDQGRARRY